MAWDSAHVRAPLKPLDPQSSPPSSPEQYHKRQRSRTLGTTFVSTTVVPAPSSTDVLSSLITSLTLLSDSAREQIRDAREVEPVLPQPVTRTNRPVISPPPDAHSDVDVSIEEDINVFDASEADEAEPPAVGYTRSQAKDQRRPSSKEKWSIHMSGRDKASNLGSSGSNQTMRRPRSATPSSIGIPSIDRGPGDSSSSLVVPPSSGTKSPLKMFFSTRQDDDYNYPIPPSSKDADSRSVKSSRTTKSKQSVRVSQDPETESVGANSIAPVEQLSPIHSIEKRTPEHKTYSHLSPAHREDLGEHLIPSRRSSIRNSPSVRGSSKGRSPGTGKHSRLPSRSFSTTTPEAHDLTFQEQPIEEEDATLRRIRELQQAKEQRQMEWRKESRKSERTTSRSLRNRSKSMKENRRQKEEMQQQELISQAKYMTPLLLQNVEKSESNLVTASIVREIDVASPPPNALPAAPSPALSTPRKHKRSLSVSIRRSASLKYRPVDDLRSVSDQVEAFLTAPRLTQRIRHPRTGRTIAFSEVGDPDGFAVFCCVGMGLTRYVTSFYDDVARTQKLRLITPDRPGIGESSPFPDNICTPLAWADDVAVICQALRIEKFSLLAHSAGSIYALATALKMPDKIRGRIHLLAPWITPSQFPSGTANGEIKVAYLPMAHKLLSILPAPLLRAANSRFLSATSASIDPRTSKGRKKDISTAYDTLLAEMAADIEPGNLASTGTGSLRYSSLSRYARTPESTPPPYNYHNGMATPPHSPSPTNMRRQFSASASKLSSPTPNESSMGLSPHARQALLNQELTHRTWALATLNANPAVDLLVCLERRRPVGFRYVDVTRGVVIHHGRKDTRVPLTNAQWLSQAMKRCDLRVLDDEGHGLMASANVMSRVLAEIGREWEEWDVIARENERRQKDMELERERMQRMERRRFVREGR